MKSRLMTMHGTMVVYNNHGIMLTGAPGIGKSLLASNLIDFGFKLVGDDSVILLKKQNKLLGFAPKKIRGQLMTRHRHLSPIRLAQGKLCSVAPLSFFCHLVDHKRLQSCVQTPTIVYQHVLGVSLPEVLLPLSLSSKTPENVNAVVHTFKQVINLTIKQPSVSS